MDIDDADLIPVGGGSLRRRLVGPRRRPVAQFTLTAFMHPDDVWSPLGRDMGDGQQGDPFGSARPGHGLEHEPLNRAERYSQHTAQNAANAYENGHEPRTPAYQDTARDVRAAMRGGIPAGPERIALPEHLAPPGQLLYRTAAVRGSN